MNEQQSSLPTAAIYEQEYIYWPWGRLVEWVASWVEANAPSNALIVDYMCGTGFLLNEIAKRRRDLSVCGCSITPSFIEWARERYEHINVVLEDAFEFDPPADADVILCTAGLHHLPYERQALFLDKVLSELRRDGRFLIGEEVIAADESGAARQAAVLDLWFSLMHYAVQREAPDGVLQAAIDVMKADLCADGEYKRSRVAIEDMLRRRFRIIDYAQTWPDGATDYGDGVWVCAPRSMGGGTAT